MLLGAAPNVAVQVLPDLVTLLPVAPLTAVPACDAVSEDMAVDMLVLSVLRAIVVPPLLRLVILRLTPPALSRVTDFRSVSAVTVCVANAVRGDTGRVSSCSDTAVISVLTLANGVLARLLPPTQLAYEPVVQVYKLRVGLDNSAAA